MEKLQLFVQHMLTGRDNLTYDLGRVLWALAFVFGVGIATYCAINGKSFDLQNYGIGVGALLLAGGAALKLKENTEPKSKDESTTS
jgi:hypothetical protein